MVFPGLFQTFCNISGTVTMNFKCEVLIFVYSFTIDTTMYSFSVRLHEDTVINDSPCVFGTVDLNIGDGYDEFSGQYISVKLELQ